MKLNRVTPFRLSEEQHREVVEVADRLGLTPSEITRRSLRIALPMFRGINVPGAERKERPEHQEAR